MLFGKVAASSSHGSNELDKEYLLLNEDDILQLEKDFHDKKLKFDHKDKQISIWKKDQFQNFLNIAKRYLKTDLHVIYYEV